MQGAKVFEKNQPVNLSSNPIERFITYITKFAISNHIPLEEAIHHKIAKEVAYEYGVALEDLQRIVENVK